MRRELLRQEPLIDKEEGISNGTGKHHKVHSEAVPPTCNVYKCLFTISSSFTAVAESGDETDLEPPTI